MSCNALLQGKSTAKLQASRECYRLLHMARSNTESAQDLVPVTLRLFREDVKRMREEAEISHVPWQVRVRLLVHEALRGPRARVIR